MVFGVLNVGRWLLGWVPRWWCSSGWARRWMRAGFLLRYLAFLPSRSKFPSFFWVGLNKKEPLSCRRVLILGRRVLILIGSDFYLFAVIVLPHQNLSLTTTKRHTKCVLDPFFNHHLQTPDD